jgi:UDP:flavonoid glycosyltransferase YjiC (YdhE family)
MRKGFAKRLSKRRITAPAVLDAIDTMLHDKNAKEEVVKFQHELMKWNGPKNAAEFLYRTFSERKNNLTNKVRLCEPSEPQSEPFVGQARRKCWF